jgi:protein-S-isoprenylcysteine O-methyltransferase Ste14
LVSLDARIVLFDAAAVALCLVPAQLFARWTRDDRNLPLRAALHPIFHSALLLGILPAFIVALGGGGWHAAFARPSSLNKIYLQLLFVPATFLISSVQEFVARGQGTPMPADAPRRLVTSGPYAYVRNPMQLGKIAMLLGWASFWWNPWFAAAAAGGLLYSVCIAIPREDGALRNRFGSAWTGYSKDVRRWIPHWRPFAPPELARLYLDLGCGSCSQFAAWLHARSPVGLTIVSAAQHPDAPLARMRYEPADRGTKDAGILALARALEHLNLAWAFCGWMARLPGISWLAQLVADTLDPRAAARCVTGNAPTVEDLP